MKSERVPWWDALPEDFYRQSNDAEIGTAPSQSVRATAAVDRVARSVLSAAPLPAIYTRRGIEQQLRALEHHKALAARGDGDATFARPIGQPLVQEMRPGKLGGSKETFLTASSASAVFSALRSSAGSELRQAAPELGRLWTALVSLDESQADTDLHPRTHSRFLSNERSVVLLAFHVPGRNYDLIGDVKDYAAEQARKDKTPES